MFQDQVPGDGPRSANMQGEASVSGSTAKSSVKGTKSKSTGNNRHLL